MSDTLRDRIADIDEKHYQMLATDGGWLCACGHRFSGNTYREWRLHKADAVLEMLTVHIPPIVASAIHGYADSQIVALDYHGDGSAIEEMRRLNSEAAQIANYATTHERWNGD